MSENIEKKIQGWMSGLPVTFNYHSKMHILFTTIYKCFSLIYGSKQNVFVCFALNSCI